MKKLYDYSDLENIPGIYLIRNSVNGKCYVGQTIRLKTRIKDHYSIAISNKCENQRKRMLLYKAIEKYGVDNFEYSILWSTPSLDYNNIKKELDRLEKQYIVEYNSYVNTGYNQTNGGDAGILGFKMNDEQKKIISKNSHYSSLDGKNMVYCYDIIEKVYYTMVNIPSLNSVLGTNLRTSQIRNLLVNNRYVLSRNKEDLLQKILKLDDKKFYKDRIDGHFKEKYTSEMEVDLINGMSEKEFCTKYNVCRKSYNNYKKKAIPGYKRVYKSLVDKDEFIAYYNQCKSQKMCMKHFGITYKRCHKYVQRYGLNNY